MTLDEMKAVAQSVVDALKAGGIEATIHEEDIVPGEPIPISFEKGEDLFTLDLMIA